MYVRLVEPTVTDSFLSPAASAGDRSERPPNCPNWRPIPSSSHSTRPVPSWIRISRSSTPGLLTIRRSIQRRPRSRSTRGPIRLRPRRLLRPRAPRRDPGRTRLPPGTIHTPPRRRSRKGTRRALSSACVPGVSSPAATGGRLSSYMIRDRDGPRTRKIHPPRDLHPASSDDGFGQAGALQAIACGSGGSRGNSVIAGSAEDSGVNADGNSGGAMEAPRRSPVPRLSPESGDGGTGPAGVRSSRYDTAMLAVAALVLWGCGPDRARPHCPGGGTSGDGSASDDGAAVEAAAASDGRQGAADGGGLGDAGRLGAARA